MPLAKHAFGCRCGCGERQSEFVNKINRNNFASCHAKLAPRINIEFRKTLFKCSNWISSFTCGGRAVFVSIPKWYEQHWQAEGAKKDTHWQKRPRNQIKTIFRNVFFLFLYRNKLARMCIDEALHTPWPNMVVNCIAWSERKATLLKIYHLDDQRHFANGFSVGCNEKHAIFFSVYETLNCKLGKTQWPYGNLMKSIISSLWYEEEDTHNYMLHKMRHNYLLAVKLFDFIKKQKKYLEIFFLLKFLQLVLAWMICRTRISCRCFNFSKNMRK